MILLFSVFCLLLASRDAFSHLLLAQAVDPIVLLTVYCTSACIFALIFRIWRTRSLDFKNVFVELPRSQKFLFLKLGVATWIVYVATIFGIQSLGAAPFNLIDYGAMPILTLLSGVVFLRERLSRWHVLGSITGLTGFALLTLGPSTLSMTNWDRVGVLLAVVSAVSTSLSSLYQKQQIAFGLHPDEVLLFRFPIPAVLMICWVLFHNGVLQISNLPAMLLVAFFGVFLPLLLLCFGFMRASLSHFASFLFLIPLFTFVLGPLLVKGEWNKFIDPRVLSGMTLILAGYFASTKANKKA
ncbi:DMT family transporter [Prosthecobacter sp.]|uniref:DMT family transporter n=1 Tax=Prosthecobacter sp. TaxID=1965333 RepID=UPI0037847F2E